MRDNLIIDAYEFRNGDWPETELTGAAMHSRRGYYAPARPEGFASLFYRFRASWLVFTGQADALVWPQQGYFPSNS